MVSGLDSEIRSVRDYLEGRKVSAGRFTLQGVRGAESPESFSSFVLLNSEIAPIDIRVQPNSMERVVDLLGGPALYRGDPLAPVRELIQNCRDAIALRNALETIDHQDLTPGRIEISLNTAIDPPILKVRDNGIGMTRSVVKNHLISVASNFWESVDYARDFSRAGEAGFQPIGRFGIGFLSVFMLGTYIEVETERVGSPRILLRLRGLGRRGELVEKMPTGRPGTEVRVHISEKIAKSLANLPAIVKARAPMLRYRIQVEHISSEGVLNASIEPMWWANASSSDLYEYLARWEYIARSGSSPEVVEINSKLLGHNRIRPNYPRIQRLEKSAWPGARPEVVEESGRLVDSGENGASGILLCSHGIAIEVARVAGIFGLAETGEIEVSPDRNSLVVRDEEKRPEVLGQLTQRLIPPVRDAIDRLEHFGSIPARFSFLRELGERYGSSLLSMTSLPWIPTLEQPGNLIHRSSTELKRYLESESSVVICSGISPGKAYVMAEHRLVASELNRSLEILLPNNEFSIGYELSKRLEVQEGSSRLRGKFDEIIEKADCKREGFLMLGVLLDIVAEAWSVSRSFLEAQSWEMDIDFTRTYLWVNLKRQDLDS
jgi:hypothetical protein